MYIKPYQKNWLACSPEKAKRLRRVLTTDPGMGVFRHADAGYELAQQVAQERGAKIPGLE